MCTIFRKLTIVYYERESVCQKKKNLLEKAIVTINCLLWDKDNILNLFFERTYIKFIGKGKCVQISIYGWIKMRV